MVCRSHSWQKSAGGTRMITVMQMTCKEMLRKRVFLLTLVMTGIFLIAFWFLAKALHYESSGDLNGSRITEVQLLMNHYARGVIIMALGFFFASFVLAFLMIFSPSATISGEAELGVLQAVMPRPISRPAWYMGRWTGYTLVGILYAALLFGTIVIITYIHAAIPTDSRTLIRSFGFFALIVPLLVSLSMFGSCLFTAIGNSVVMMMLFGTGWLGGMIEKVGTAIKMEEAVLQPLMKIAGILSMVMPADSLQRRMLAELFSFNEIGAFINLNEKLEPFSIGQVPSNSYLLYTLCYILLALGGGIWCFRRKDL